ncbi:hypothetical protein Pyn_10428 [Prunus yedoensis var. nudiflora]|uniref:Uncharacterized protein n=1 Tax=Prunus yedoensis var. nudiflora TaxID=2094558 RepID=A0A314XTB7_PRUYE|nr:hypothetical protein Pyn_10428 [Prunus yedoensis var. nudiflora]
MQKALKGPLFLAASFGNFPTKITRIEHKRITVGLFGTTSHGLCIEDLRN